MRKTGGSKKCDNCGDEFHVPAWRENTGKPVRFCSMACLYAGRKKRERKTVDAVCEQCGLIYKIPLYRKGTARFCSNRCVGVYWMPTRKAVLAEGTKKNPRPRMSPEIKTAKKKASDADWYAKNKEYAAQKNAESYLKNREARAAKNREWSAKNKDRVSEANRRRRETNGDEIRAKRRQHYRDNKARYVAQARSREKHIKRATPPWADMEAIAAFYVEAERLTRETGVKHHVDHAHPLRGKMSWGLHVVWNLQIMTAAENLKKSNKEDHQNGC